MHSGLIIRRMVFVETGTYNPVVHRPYQPNVRQDLVDLAAEATRGGTRTTPGDLAGVASQLIAPSAEAFGTVQIANGWNVPRYRFFMEAEHSNYQGGKVVQYITGYTDHTGGGGVSHQGHLDPQMRLVFNSIVTVRYARQVTPMGEIWVPTISANDHLMHGNHRIFTSHQADSMLLMRPEDVLHSIGNAIFPEGSVIDARTSFNNVNMRKSTRNNLNIPNYLSRTIRAYQKASSADQYDADMPLRMDDAASYVHENDIRSDIFLNTLMIQTEFREGQSVSWSELNQVCPGLDAYTEVIQASAVQKFGRLSENDGEYWTQTTNEVVTATILTHAVPGMMLDSMLTKVEFSCHNRTLNGEPEFLFLDHPKSFVGSDVDLTPQYNRFMTRFIHEVFTSLTRNGQWGMQIRVKMDVIGDTVIHIDIDGSQPVMFTTPSFADGLYAPIWATSQQQLDTFAHQIGVLTDQFEMVTQPPYVQTPSRSQFGI